MTTSTSRHNPKPNSAPNLTPGEITDLGEKIYRAKIRPTLIESDIGKFVHIDVNTGEYEIDDDDISGEVILCQRVPNAKIYTLRVGYSAAYFMGGHYEEPQL